MGIPWIFPSSLLQILIGEVHWVGFKVPSANFWDWEIMHPEACRTFWQKHTRELTIR